ncbi:MAG: hypothetical protein IPN91_03540 [Holophagaceae bacterium]|uniref:Uncharacterized protein n=1 Tax=Candidatus Geothrix odensensis TaxID=2954440 RepID=A0A936F0P7_9BACT|nr:hypothetical protein [Candidatus Geothrix odensensis]
MSNIRVFALTGSLLLALGCGGSGGGGGSVTPPLPVGPQNPAGIYAGTIQSVAATVIVLDSGEFSWATNNGLLATGNLVVSGGSFTGTGTLWAPNGTYFTGVGFTAPVTITNGTVVTASTMSASYTSPVGNGSFHFTYNPVFTRQVTLTTLAGNYNYMQDGYGYPVSISILSDGTFTGRWYVTPDSRAFSGTITQPNPSQNAFRVQLNMPGVGPYPIPSNYSGLGFLTDGTSMNSDLTILLTDSGNQWALRFKR